MLITVTLNPAIDRRLHVMGFAPGQVHRTTAEHATAGGKGLNVARVIAQLGEPVEATGFLGGANGTWIRRQLDEAGIAHRFVDIAGPTRTCLNIIDDRTGISTEVLESGPIVSPEEQAALLDQVRIYAAAGACIVFSGSLPRGCAPVYYRQLIAAVVTSGGQAILDTSGEALAQGLAAGPCAVKPNEEEIARLARLAAGRAAGQENGHADGEAGGLDEAAITRALRGPLFRGVRCAVVTLGARGCLAAMDGRLYRVRMPTITAVNAVGSGDAFVAGLAVAWHRGLDPVGSLRLSAAAGASNAMQDRTGVIRLDDIARLLPEIEVSAEMESV